MSGLPAAFFDAIRQPVFGGRITQEQVDNTTKLVAEAIRRGLLKNQAANVLGQCAPETAFTMAPVREAFYISDDFDRAERWRKNNLRYFPWYGRGHIQLTWEFNYQRQKERTGIDFIADPDKVMEWDNSVDIMFHGMMNGTFTGRALPEFVNENRTDHANARRVVNGTQAMHKIAAYARAFERGLQSVEWSTEGPPEEPPADPRLFELTQVVRDATLEIDAILRGDEA